MAFTKPMVTIELAEYNELKEKKLLKGTDLTMEEYEGCYTALIVQAIRSPELVNNMPPFGIALAVGANTYMAKIDPEQRVVKFSRKE